MKLNTLKNNSSKGFTLIEMIGVLAVIAILAALLIPKVFQAITEARINTVPVGCSTIKTATIDHYAKYNGLNVLFGTNSVTAPQSRYDVSFLLAEGFIDKPFAPRVGATNDVQLVAAIAATGPVTATDAGYALSGGTANQATGTHVVQAIVGRVPIADAQAISQRIDGTTLSQLEGAVTADLTGRVKYGAPGTDGLTDVYIYLTHR